MNWLFVTLAESCYNNSFIFLLKIGGAQEITVFPGFGGNDFYQDKYPITKEQFESLLKKNNVANAYWMKSKKHRLISVVAIGAEFGFFVLGVSGIGRGNTEVEVLSLIGVGSCAIASVVFSRSSARLLKMSILEYNEGLDHETSLNIGATQNGVGLVVNF